MMTTYPISSTHWLILAVLLIGFFLRVWQLPTSPPGLWYDEAYHGMDALAMGDSGHTPIFFIGNNGREPLWTYLVSLSISLWGNSPFAIRWVAALAGMLTLPIFYRFARLISRAFVIPSAQRRWFALLAMSWLAVSWWHLHLSRAGFRAVLLPPLLMASLYYFRLAWSSPTVSTWQTWLLPAMLSGLFLGLSQYTYLPARLAPLIFVGLAVGQSWSHRRQGGAGISKIWLILLTVAAMSVLMFIPLGYFFYQNPTAFSARTSGLAFYPANFHEFMIHLKTGLSLFWGAGHALFRHHLLGRAMLGWLEIPFFWLGLIGVCCRDHLRQFEGQLILLGLSIMLLPSILAQPPVHGLRPVGIIPFYYFLVTFGLWKISKVVQPRLSWLLPRLTITPTLICEAVLLLILLNGTLNGYDYFERWATHPEVYRVYNGLLVDLVARIQQETEQGDVLIPFHLYAHPTVRYLLHEDFTEQASPPRQSLPNPIQLLHMPQSFPLLFVGNIPQSASWVWLTRKGTGAGAAYVSRLPRHDEIAAIDQALTEPPRSTFENRFSEPLAFFKPISSPVISSLFETEPLRTADLVWGQADQPLAELLGYEVTPMVAQPSQPITVNFYWRSLTDDTFNQRLFLQLIDSTGQPINQWEGEAFKEDMYRWRPAGILPTQHTLWLGPDTPDGAYLIRLGFFDAESGARLPLRHMTEPTDQIQLGLFYLSADGSDPRQPAEPRSANFANLIELVGLTGSSRLYDDDAHWTGLPTQLHWRTIKPTDKPYTVFLQLLNEDGVVITSWDRQPFAGLYPTNRWSPNELLVDRFTLPPPQEPLPPGRYRLITGFYDFATWERLPLATSEDFVELAVFEVTAEME